MKRILEYKDILVYGHAGEEGACKIFKEKYEDMSSLFKKEYVNKLQEEYTRTEKSGAEFADILQEILKTEKDNIFKAIEVKDCGIITAIYELAVKFDIGAEIEIKKIPIKQSTVEICEKYDLNPYRLLSRMCLLICKNGYEIEHRLAKKGIEAVKIGELTLSKDKIVSDKEEVEYLNKETKDELYKVIGR